MIYTRPFVTTRFVAHAGDSRTHVLSLAVEVLDAFTRRPAEVSLRVLLKERPRFSPLLTRGGFYCFEAVPAGTYTLLVEPDRTNADWFYLQPRPGENWSDGFERAVTLPMPDPKRPLETVALSPKPSYHFPPNATLIRGRVVRGANSDPIAAAVVKTNYSQVDPKDTSNQVAVDVETQTDIEGEFVLFFQALPTKFQTVTLTAMKGAQLPPQPIEIEEGTTKTNIQFVFP